MINSNCQLGEGLYVKNGKAAWVDITKDQVFLFSACSLDVLSTVNKPSVIYDIGVNEIHFGSDSGLIALSSLTGKERTLKDVSHMHNTIEYRSNDGGFCGKHQLVGFMHRTNSVGKAGFVYRVSGDTWRLLDDTIHIPNAFIEIEPSRVLIANSLNGQIWLFELDLNGNLRNKTLWAQLETGVAPDGGCLVGDFILIALWDSAAIGVFTKAGELIEKIAVPVIRPTNCKYDEEAGQLWVTSASEGLSKDLLTEYPDSGNTFVFDLELP